MNDKKKRLIDAADFLTEILPPEYIIEPMLLRGQIAAITAPTQHGKSAVSHLFSISVGLGKVYTSFRARHGRSLMLFGENAGNAKLQFFATCLYYGIQPEELRDRVVIYPYGGSILEAVNYIGSEAGSGQWGEFDFVNLDTSAAYFDGDDENSNALLREHASMQRRLTMLPGHPNVLSNCHPKLNATRDCLIPRGGSAFLNEIDSNLTLWNDGTMITLHHTKMRGPPFDPISFKLDDYLLKFANGKTMAVPVAVPISDSEQLALMDEHYQEEKTLLDAMRTRPTASMREWAQVSGWKMKDGSPYHVKAGRVMKRLSLQKKVKMVGSRWMLSSSRQATAD